MLYTNKAEDGALEENPFDSQQSRKCFIVRVYALLFVCLTATAVQCAAVRLSDKMMDFFRPHWWIFFICLAVYLVAYFSLVCFYCTRHTFPLNLALLIVLVEAMSIMCVYGTARYKTNIVLNTFILTAIVCLLITLIAVFSPIDFTGCRFLIMVLGIVTVLLGVAAAITSFVWPNHMLRLVYSGVAVAFLSLVMAYDTQMVFGGRHDDLGQDEVIYGAVSLYTDIMQMFLHLLVLVNECF